MTYVKVPVLYIRIPPALKTAVEREAKKKGQSVNCFVMRCLEKGTEKTQDGE